MKRIGRGALLVLAAAAVVAGAASVWAQSYAPHKYARVYKVQVPRALRSRQVVTVEVHYAVRGPVFAWEHALGELYVIQRHETPGAYSKGMFGSGVRFRHLAQLSGSRRSVVVRIPADARQKGTFFELVAASDHRSDLRITGHGFPDLYE